MLKENSLQIVLNALKVGLPVKFPSFEYELHLSEEGTLCYLMSALSAFESQDGQFLQKEDKCMGWDPSFSWFYRQCMSLPEEYLVILASNTALNRIKHSKDVL